jgi:hypothetical protein
MHCLEKGGGILASLYLTGRIFSGIIVFNHSINRVHISVPGFATISMESKEEINFIIRALRQQ